MSNRTVSATPAIVVLNSMAALKAHVLAVTSKADAALNAKDSPLAVELRSIVRRGDVTCGSKMLVEALVRKIDGNEDFRFEKGIIPMHSCYKRKDSADGKVKGEVVYKSNEGTDSDFERYATVEEINEKFDVPNERFAKFVADTLGLYE